MCRDKQKAPCSNKMRLCAQDMWLGKIIHSRDPNFTVAESNALNLRPRLDAATGWRQQGRFIHGGPTFLSGKEKDCEKSLDRWLLCDQTQQSLAFRWLKYFLRDRLAGRRQNDVIFIPTRSAF